MTRYLLILCVCVCLLPAMASAQSSIGAATGLSSAGPIPVYLGGNGCGPPVNFAQLPTNPMQGMQCFVKDATSCAAGTPVTAGSGSNMCQVVWDGATPTGHWQPGGIVTSAAIGGVTAVNASAPLASSGGVTPTISFSAPVTAAQGGTGSTSVPSAGQVPVGNAGGTAFAPVTVTGDLGINSSGAVTITKVNGVTPGTIISANSPLPIANGGTGTAVPGSTVGTGLSVSGSFPAQAFSLTTPVSVANGGTGSSSPAITAGTGITLGGSFPSQSVALTTPVTVANGGTQCGAPVVFASLPGSPTNGEICNVTDSSVGCVAGTPVTAGSGSTKCQVTWNGTNWVPGGGVTSAASGGVSSVGATAPITSSGGATPTIALTTPLSTANGGSGLTSPTAHNIPIAEGATAMNLIALANDQILAGSTGADPTQMSVPDCRDSSGNHLNYNNSTHTLSCGNTTNPVGSVAAANVTAGTFSGAFTFASAPTMSGANITSATIPTGALQTVQGNGTKVQLSTGTTTTNDCVAFDANGNTVDSGGGCGAGGGTVNAPTEVGDNAYYAGAAATISGVPHYIHAGTGTLATAFANCPSTTSCVVVGDPGQTYTVSAPLTWGTSHDQVLLLYGRINCTDTTGGRDCLDIDRHGHLIGGGIGDGATNDGCIITDSGTANITSLVTNASHSAADGFDLRSCLLDSNTGSTITKAVLWLSGEQGFGYIDHISITAAPTGGSNSGIQYLLDDNGGTRAWNQIDNIAVNLACGASTIGLDITSSTTVSTQFTWYGGTVTDCAAGATAINIDGGASGHLSGVWINGVYLETHGAGNDLIKVNNAHNIHILGAQFTEAAGGVFTNCVHLAGSAGNTGEVQVSGRMTPTACTNTITNDISGYGTTTAGDFNYTFPGTNGVVDVVDNGNLLNGFGPGKAGVYYSAAGTAIPSCASSLARSFACVSDATACTSGTTYTSGGGTSCLLECNTAGNAWKETGTNCF